VKEGGVLQKKTQSVAEDKFGEIASRMSSLAGEVQAKAGQQWGKLDSLFDDRTAKALKTLGVPTANDLSAMQARIDALDAKVALLTKARSAATKTPAKAPVKPTGMPAPREMERGDELIGKSMPAGLPPPKPPAAKTKAAAAKKGVANSALKRHLR
jgi:poly(hydroxyalkanoate) granule-associated protein